MLKKFAIMFNDLNSEAQERYCKTAGIEIGDVVNFPIAYAEYESNNDSDLAEELGVETVLDGPFFEVWRLFENGSSKFDNLLCDSLLCDDAVTFEEAKRFVEDNNLTSDDESTIVIEEVYEVDDGYHEPYFKARNRTEL